MDRDNTYDNLYPPFVDLLKQFEEKLKTNNIEAFPFETYRSFDRQLELYKQGREWDSKKESWIVISKKKIITNALPGLSYHAYGLAVDFAFDADSKKAGIQWSWDNKFPWTTLGEYGKDCGLEWGGDWQTFPEYPHFQKTWGLPIHKAYDIFQSGGIKAVWKELDKYDKT